MKLTVGPLAPAVYWRRRVAVVGALVLAVYAGFSLGDHFAAQAARKGVLIPVAGGPGGEPGATEEPSSDDGPRPSGSASSGSSANASRKPSGQPVGSGGAGRRQAPACADGDLAVTAAATPESGVYGGTFSLSLSVRNTSGRECERDIGSGPQELRVLRAGALVWSSDACGEQGGSDVRTFQADAGVRYTLQWNSHQVAPDMCQVSSEPAPPGDYQVVARLGGKLSQPAPFEIVK